MRSQLHALSRQIPLMYFVLITTTLGLASTHLDVAPPGLTLVFPALLSAICIGRFVMWLRRRHVEFSVEGAVRRLRMTMILAGLLGAAFTGWALSLYPYGGVDTQSHIVFYIAVTTLACMFCLTHLRGVAPLLTIVVLVPTAVFFVTTGNAVFIAMSLNMLLVAAAIIFMMLTSYRHFAHLIETQQTLMAQQAETAALNVENLQLANLDSLTDLPNRRRFFSELDVLVSQGETNASEFTVGLVDLDGFKPVNDLYGHAVGDKVLIEVGRRLQALSTRSSFLARLGGDEFAYLIMGERSEAEIALCGQQICAALQRPYHIGDLTVQLSGSVGFATRAKAGADAAHLLECADYALYEAKQSQRGTALMFSPDLETRIRTNALIEQGLRHPDLAGQLGQAYQPIYDVRNGRTIGFEALARWTSPTLGVVRPDVFVQLAERTGLVCQLTEMLLRKALSEAMTWPKQMRLSFNLSTLDIATQDAVARLAAIVTESGMDPGRIDLEITETAVMRDFEQACAALTQLRAIGLKIALDDFGSGNSSLSYVHRLPLDKIKIDRGFIAEIETAATCKNIVKSVIDLCRNLELECVVEGVETAAQLAILCQLGCWNIQGYFISKPLSAEGVVEFLSRETAPLSRAV